LTYNITENHRLAGFGYILDFENSPFKSNNTLGGSYVGDVGWLQFKIVGAMQRENNDASREYSADYLNIEASLNFDSFGLTGGWEVLGSDEGIGFKTPLASHHEFQGWADKFTVTPANGLEDIYGEIRFDFSGVELGASYHQFTSFEDDDDYGSEVDFYTSYAFYKHYEVVFKTAYFMGGDFTKDTTKLWLQFKARF
jgi:hypothetical protein